MTPRILSGPGNRIPRSLLRSVVKQLCLSELEPEFVLEGAKYARQASTPVERCASQYMRIDAEIKDDARRANSLRTFNLRLAPKVYSLLSVKEVIQPQVPLRLPCYDFAPVMTLAFGRLVPCGVPTRTSGARHFHGVTGGVYKARERIHRGDADPRLLAIPASCRRVADDNPN